MVEEAAAADVFAHKSMLQALRRLNTMPKTVPHTKPQKKRFAHDCFSCTSDSIGDSATHSPGGGKRLMVTFSQRGSFSSQPSMACVSSLDNPVVSGIPP